MALDECEPHIIRALEKDGWQIFNKPHLIRTDVRTVYADFSLTRTLPDGTGETIVVFEVKCFTREKSDLQEFYTAVGQYRYYKTLLLNEPESYPLFLAVPDSAYKRLVSDTMIEATFQSMSVSMVLIDIETEQVTQWII